MSDFRPPRNITQGPRPALKWIAKKKRDPRPKKVVWESYYPGDTRSYWLANARAEREDLTVGEWDGKSTFRIKSEAADLDALAVLLDDRMTDLDRPVTVFLEGKKVFEGVPQRTLLALMRSARARRDPELLFTARIDLKSR